MICKQILPCVRGLRLKNQFQLKTGQLKGKHAKTHEKPQIAPIVVGNSCRSADQVRACVRFLDARPNAKCSEDGKSYLLLNPDNRSLLGLRLDHGAFETTAFHKCDYAFMLLKQKQRKDEPNEPECVILIELKGDEVKKSLTQLNDTLDLPELQDLYQTAGKVYGRIATSGENPRKTEVPNMNRLFEQKRRLARRFQKLNGNLKIRGIEFEESCDKLDLLDVKRDLVL